MTNSTPIRSPSGDITPTRTEETMKNVRTAISAATLAILLILSGCGSDADTGSDAASASEGSAEAPAEQPGGPGGLGGFDADQVATINECLEAAGVDAALPTEMPTDMPTERPSDMPEDFDPETMDPEDLPEGMRSGGPDGGGAFGALQDPEVQEALEACGIELPQRPAPNTD
jgi:hypothetical protein